MNESETPADDDARADRRTLSRRSALRLMLATGALTACGRGADTPAEVAAAPASGPKAAPPRPDRMPCIFLAHGSPMLLDDAKWVGELRAWASAMPRPRAVLMVSAHWVKAPLTLGATTTVPLVYDFTGFPDRYYEVLYPAPGAPELARRIRELLAGRGNIVDEPERGLDHGAYVPLVAMYPAADVPVLQISIPTMTPAKLVLIGRALAPLRDEGVLVVGSGFLTHNLSAPDDGGDKPPTWASDFDAWTEDALRRRDVDLLVQYREKAPGVALSLPTHEHFVPVLVALGASTAASESVKFPIAGFMRSFTRRSVQFG